MATRQRLPKSLVFVRQQHVVAGAHQFATVPRLCRQPLRIRRALPLFDKPLAQLRVRRRQRTHRLLHRSVASLADADRHRELARGSGFVLCAADFAHRRHVAIRGGPKLPIHFEVLHQVLPAVARTHKPATQAAETAARTHCQRPLVLPRQHCLALCKIHCLRCFSRAAAIQVRRQQGIDPQARQQILAPLQPHVHHHHAVVRIADDLFGEGIPAPGIAVYIAHSKRLRMQVLKDRLHVALLFVRKGLAIANEKLHVAHLSKVNRQVINLVQNLVRAGEPHAARSPICRAYRILHARSPSWLHTGASKGLALLLKPPEQRLISHRHPLFSLATSTSPAGTLAPHLQISPQLTDSGSL